MDQGGSGSYSNMVNRIKINVFSIKEFTNTMLKLHQPLAITHQLAEAQMLELAGKRNDNQFSKRSSVGVSDVRDGPTSAKAPKHVVRGKKKCHYTDLLLFVFPVLFSFNVQEQLLKIRRAHLHQAFLAGLPAYK